MPSNYNTLLSSEKEVSEVFFVNLEHLLKMHKIAETNYIIGVIKADARYKQLIEIKVVIKSEYKSNSY